MADTYIFTYISPSKDSGNDDKILYMAEDIYTGTISTTTALPRHTYIES